MVIQQDIKQIYGDLTGVSLVLQEMLNISWCVTPEYSVKTEMLEFHLLV